MLLLNGIKLPLEHDQLLLADLCAKRLGCPREVLRRVQLLRRSVDARDKRDVHLVVSALVTLDDEEAETALLAACRSKQVSLYRPKELPALPKAPAAGPRPLVVGAGPAGLLAALTLARAGARPILVERGRPVEERAADVARFLAGGGLRENSNTLFGEGGAGAFSDGKLTTGTKSPFIPGILRDFVRFGAPEEILTDAKPHIGTDRLLPMLQALRAQLLTLGAEIRFSTCLTGLVLRDGALRAAVLEGPEGAYELEAEHLLLCIGHSARDSFAFLHRLGVAMEQKPFSMGVRVEHPQTLIDRAQYGGFAGHPALGAADYKLFCHLKGGRGVYSFCMCPGGRVIPATAEQGLLCVNGMSAYARDGENANAALLVGVEPADFGAADPLAGVRLQQKYEALAFREGGGDFRAPAMRMENFLRGGDTLGFGQVTPSYRPDVTPGDLNACLPPYVTEALRAGIAAFARQLKGFDLPDAVLTGVETRSSSPLRLPRGQDLQSLSVRGLYPVGEGAGYAGGILSAAADGVRCALAVLQGE